MQIISFPALRGGGDRVTILKLPSLQIYVYLRAFCFRLQHFFNMLYTAQFMLFCLRAMWKFCLLACYNKICCCCTDFFCPFLLVLDLLLPGFDANCQFTRFNVSLTSGKIPVILLCYFYLSLLVLDLLC